MKLQSWELQTTPSQDLGYLESQQNCPESPPRRRVALLNHIPDEVLHPQCLRQIRKEIEITATIQIVKGDTYVYRHHLMPQEVLEVRPYQKGAAPLLGWRNKRQANGRAGVRVCSWPTQGSPIDGALPRPLRPLWLKPKAAPNVLPITVAAIDPCCAESGTATGRLKATVREACSLRREEIIEAEQLQSQTLHNHHHCNKESQ